MACETTTQCSVLRHTSLSSMCTVSDMCLHVTNFQHCISMFQVSSGIQCDSFTCIYPSLPSPPFVSLSVHLSFHLSLCLSVCLSVCLFACLPSLPLPVSWTDHDSSGGVARVPGLYFHVPSVKWYTVQFFYLHLSFTSFPPICFSVCPPVFPPVSLFVCLSVCLSVCLFACLPSLPLPVSWTNHDSSGGMA